MARSQKAAAMVVLSVVLVVACGCPMQKGVKAAAAQSRLFYQARQAGGSLDAAMGFYDPGFETAAWRPILAHLQASLGDVKSWKVTGTDYKYRVATNEPQPGTKVEFSLDVTYDHGRVEEKVKFYLPVGPAAPPPGGRQWTIISHTVKPIDADRQATDALIDGARMAADVFFETRRAGDLDRALDAYSPLFFSTVGEKDRPDEADGPLAPGADPIPRGRARWKADLERVRSVVGDVVTWEFRGHLVARKQDLERREFFGDYVTLTLDVTCQNAPREEQITFTKVFGATARWLIMAHHIRPPEVHGGE